MIWKTLEKVWKTGGRKNVKARFSDWTHEIKYFKITGENSDGTRFTGMLDTGEKMTFPKKSNGWEVYTAEAEYKDAHPV